MPSKEFHIILDSIRSQSNDFADLSQEEVLALFSGEQKQSPIVDGADSEEVLIGEMRAEWISPVSGSDGFAILYLHGGGYCFGSLNTHRNVVSYISKAADTRSLLIDYRLAPANRFPAALEDAMSAYQWMAEKGIPPQSIIIGGDSAGAGLALALTLQLKKSGGQAPLAVFCLSPWVDLAVTGDSMERNAAIDPMVSRESLLELAARYLDDADPRDPLASPLYGDLSGFPPMLIQVGGAEVLLDDSVRLAEKAKLSGVDVTLEVWDDMFHAWQGYAHESMPESLDAIQSIGRFIKQRKIDETIKYKL